MLWFSKQYKHLCVQLLSGYKHTQTESHGRLSMAYATQGCPMLEEAAKTLQAAWSIHQCCRPTVSHTYKWGRTSRMIYRREPDGFSKLVNPFEDHILLQTDQLVDREWPKRNATQYNLMRLLYTCEFSTALYLSFFRSLTVCLVRRACAVLMCLYINYWPHSLFKCLITCFTSQTSVCRPNGSVCDLYSIYCYKAYTVNMISWLCAIYLNYTSC